MHNYTVILANGSFPQSEKCLSVLDQAGFVVCCDGAAGKLIASGREPHLIIGDLDSLQNEVREKYAAQLVHINDQMTNDLTKAVNWCIDHQRTDVIILGATGEREDHTIGNIALLTRYHKQLNVRMLTDLGEFIPFSNTTEFQSKAGQQVSVFSLNPNELINSKGLKYPLDQYQLQSWWMGTLNEALAESFTLNVKEGSSWIVYILDK
jgi:thiamine pyrophosphokinase